MMPVLFCMYIISFSLQDVYIWFATECLPTVLMSFSCESNMGVINAIKWFKSKHTSLATVLLYQISCITVIPVDNFCASKPFTEQQKITNTLFLQFFLHATGLSSDLFVSHLMNVFAFQLHLENIDNCLYIMLLLFSLFMNWHQ